MCKFFTRMNFFLYGKNITRRKDGKKLCENVFERRKKISYFLNKENFAENSSFNYKLFCIHFLHSFVEKRGFFYDEIDCRNKFHDVTDLSLE
jgi:hypothetical protein